MSLFKLNNKYHYEHGCNDKQIGVAGGAYGMTSWEVGAWWAGLGAFIASIFALLSTSK